MALITEWRFASLAALLSVQAVLASPPFYGKVLPTAGDLLHVYDYVIVGAGAGGLTVANRLSEQLSVTVVVIEAGEFDNNEDFFIIPGLAGGAVGTKYDWNTTYAASEFVGGRRVEIPHGKVVGGSTKLNRMLFDRGSKSDYDSWAALGNEGWDWNGLLPYFNKNERFTPPSEEILAEYDIAWDPAAHGTSGYMHSTYSTFFWPTTKNIVAATQELGIPIAQDQANGSPIGGYYCPHNQDPVAAIRSSAREAYYQTAVRRPNYHLISGQHVTRVLTENTPQGPKVTGIEFASAKDAVVTTVGVRKEAILAAGTLHTPQILQVSGIGDPALLSSINVTTIVDLPAVGQNLHDHVLVRVVSLINAPIVSGNLTNNATFGAEARALYNTQKKGPLSGPGADFLLFLPLSTYSNASESLYTAAEAQGGTAFLPSDTPAEVVEGYRSQHAAINEKLLATDAAVLEVIWADGLMALGLQHPYSRGSLKAASNSVFDVPIADAGFLRNPLDVALLSEAVRFARILAATDAISVLQPFEVAPGGDVTSDADLEQFIRQSSSSLLHPVGTCKMGPRAQGGVVDGELRVYGVIGLRVVDASVVPMIPASHTMTTVYALAEKAADIIQGRKSR
ncbi:hypothetical protein DL95DRAFT_495695 [Leptodontidium sp. 2 PMI_412]|nr:hypothetical protein DL95DRAFT_495695 [Leptodontidium sp. 2 PMI_412]